MADIVPGTDKMPSELKDVFQGLWREVAGLHSKWKFFRQLYGTNEERIQLLREMAPNFFGVLQNTLLDDILMSLSRLTDPVETFGRTNLSLQRLVRHLDASIDPDLPRRANEAVQRITNHCAPFRTLRNRRLAHNDLPTILSYRSDPLPGISGDMVENALSMIRLLMNDVEGCYNSAETAYEHVIQRGDGDDIIFFLQQAKAHQDCERRLDGLP